MKIITVNTGPGLSANDTHHSYKIFIGSGILDKAGELLADNNVSRRAVVISDQKVSSIYGSILQHSLSKAGFDVYNIKIPDGESYKSLDTATKIYEELASINVERITPIIALGGGVIGDLAGFIAATYMRGVPLIQIPTTVLAQADSSIGGKVAVNHKEIKNNIGTFYHPIFTLSDIDTFKTLSKREFSNGLSEVIKYGVIFDEEFFQFLERNVAIRETIDKEILEIIITKSVGYKARVVEQDTYDRGLRNILNFGHTIGHAIEFASGLSIWHGEAVAIGMVAEAQIAKEMGLITDEEVLRISRLLTTAGLPIRIPDRIEDDKILTAMQHDKKVMLGKIRFVVPTRIGHAEIIENVPFNLLRKIIGNRQ